jgi:hypothetical protein
MFGYCCDHATIVAMRQPLSALFEGATNHTRRLGTTGVTFLPGDEQPKTIIRMIAPPLCVDAGFGEHRPLPNHARRNDAIRGGKLRDHPAAITQTTAGYSV